MRNPEGPDGAITRSARSPVFQFILAWTVLMAGVLSEGCNRKANGHDNERFHPVAKDKVDTHINHVYTCEGQYSFSQVLYQENGLVQAWRMLIDRRQIPRNGDAIFIDEDGTLRKITSGEVYETDTPFDAETRNQSKLPDYKRKGLSTITPPQ